MWLSDTSIRQPVFITMVMLAALVVGIICYSRLPVDLLPDVSLSTMTIYTSYPGAGPQEVEEKVTKPLEEALGSLSGVSSVRSTSSSSVSRVMVEFRMEHPIEEAANDAREAVGMVRRRMPKDVLEPMITKADPSLLPILTFAVTSPDGQLSPEEVRQIVDDRIKPQLERIPGVAVVDVSGGLQREIQVDLRLDRLKALNVAPQQVIAALAAENLDIPGGRLTEGQRDITLRTPGQFKSMDEIGQVVVAASLGVPVRVQDVATVRSGFKEQRTLTRLDGTPSVSLSVRKQSGTNTVQVANQVHEAMAQIMADPAHGRSLSIVAARDESVFVKEATQDVLWSMILGGFLASVAVFLFFRDLRNTIIVVIGLPVIIVATFGILYILGLSLNMITLLGLALSVGFLIDDAIVVRENIFRHMEAGQAPAEAASRGTAEIALAVMATTLSIVAVFFPIVLTTGLVAKFLREFGLAVVAAVLLSLLEAFTLAPMLSAYFFRPLAEETRRGRVARFLERWGRIYDDLALGYRGLLSWAISHRLAMVIGAVVIMMASLALLPFVGMAFLPETDRASVEMAAELPVGSSLSEADAVARRVEAILWRQPQVESVFTTVGGADSERLSFLVKLKKRGFVQATQRHLRAELADLPKLSFSSGGVAGLAGTGAQAGAILGRPIQVDLRSSASIEELARVAADLMERMSDVPGLVDLALSLRPGRPELRFEVDRARAADLGLNTGSIGATIRTLVSGEKATVYRQDGREVDVVVRLREEDRARAQDLLSLPVLSPRAGAIPLRAVVNMAEATGPAEIQRENRERQVVIGGTYFGRVQGDVARDVQAVLDQYPMPRGTTYRFGGVTRLMEESFASLFAALALAVVFIYMLLASQFGSFVHPFTIMLALPLSVLGALLALILTGNTLDMMSMIGIILLMGLVTKNSILLVDFTIRLRREGLSRREALLSAGQIRLRPILMTTFAMIFGMLPIALGLGAGAELRAPMAIAVIGGLITSTLLTLVIVPVAYSLIDDLGSFLARRRRVEA